MQSKLLAGRTWVTVFFDISIRVPYLIDPNCRCQTCLMFCVTINCSFYGKWWIISGSLMVPRGDIERDLLWCMIMTNTSAEMRKKAMGKCKYVFFAVAIFSFSWAFYFLCYPRLFCVLRQGIELAKFTIENSYCARLVNM